MVSDRMVIGANIDDWMMLHFIDKDEMARRLLVSKRKMTLMLAGVYEYKIGELSSLAFVMKISTWELFVPRRYTDGLSQIEVAGSIPSKMTTTSAGTTYNVETIKQQNDETNL